MVAGSGWPNMGISADVLGGVVSAMVVLPQCLDDTPIRDSTASKAHTDRKAMRKQRQKKIALGHAEDERTEQFDFQMNM